MHKDVFLSCNPLAKRIIPVIILYVSGCIQYISYTSLLICQVIVVIQPDIFIAKYISPEWVLIRIQFAYRHAISVHEVRCLPVLRDCIPEPFCIIMVLLCEIISCYGYITVINVVRIMQLLS